MLIKILDNRTVEKEYDGNEGTQNESRITTLNLEVPEDYSEFIKKIVFITEDGNFFDYIENDEYLLKSNITKYKRVKAYIWLTNSTTNQDFRSQLFDLEFNYNENSSEYVPSEEEKTQWDLLVEELEELIDEVEALPTLKREVVEELPTTDIDPDTIYMVPNTATLVDNVYDEYMYINNQWEIIGSTAVDLTQYAKKEDLEEVEEQVETLETDLYGEVEYNITTGEKVINDTKEGRDLAVPKIYGNSTQESTTGKNLWKNIHSAGYTTTMNGVTFTVNADKSILVNGTATANTQFFIGGTPYDQTITAGTYCFSGTPIAPSASTFRMQLQLYEADSSGTQYLSANENGQKITLTSPTNTYRSYIIVYSGYTANNLVFKPQYEVGSTKTDYEQYTGEIPAPNPSYPFPIKSVTGNNNVVVSNKNLLNINDLYQGQYVDGTKTEHAQRVCTNGLIKVTPNTTYYINLYGTEAQTSMRYKITYFDKNKNFIADAEWQYVTLTHNFTTDINAEYIGVSFIYTVNWSTQNLSVSEFQTLNNGIAIISKGSTATDYVPYQNQTKPLNLGTIELNKIGNYQDYIYKNNDKWYKHEEIGKIEFSNMNWSLYNGAFYGNISGIYEASDDDNNIMCNKYITMGATTSTGSYATNNYIVWQSSNPNSKERILVRNTDYNNAQDFTLGSTGTYLYYPLATPQDIEITDTTLISQLEAIQKLKQYEGTTIITIDDIKEFDILMDGSKIEKIEDDISTLQTNVGNLTNLTTTAKTDLVSAVNEVNGAIGNIGSLLDELNGTEV